MRRLFREPLLHFLLLGAAFFLVYRVTRRGAGEGSRIVVTSGEIEHLAANFTQTWQRPPTPAEVAGLVRDRVREEVYCREAIALGLDKDDPVIRRRLFQKMEFVTTDAASRAEPTDAELEVFLRRHPEAFRLEPRFTFRQVYLDPRIHAADAPRVLARLSRIGDRDEAAALGDSTLLDAAYSGMPASEVAKTFGDAFAAKLAEATPGRWEGPIESGYGIHLVYVRERTASRLPALTEVRDAVRREWDTAQRAEADENHYRALLERYTVTIEEPPPEPKALAWKGSR